MVEKGERKVQKRVKRGIRKAVKKRGTRTRTTTKSPEIERGQDFLVPLETYLKAGVHIGSQFKSGHMKPYIYKIRQDRLAILDVKTVDERLRIAVNFISKYEPRDVLVVANRIYARKPARKFAEIIGADSICGRFVPGTLTNPRSQNFREVKLVFVSDPAIDKQAVKEAEVARVPVVALCDTNNNLNGIDIAIPINNKGKNSLSLAYWILAREILLKRGVIKSRDEFKEKLEDFEPVISK